MTIGFDILSQDKRDCLISGNLFAVNCILIKDGEQQELKGVSAQIGQTLNPDNQYIISNSDEILIDKNDVTIGIPSNGDILQIEDPYSLEYIEFSIKENIIDRTIGIYKLIVEKKKETAINPSISTSSLGKR